jgi:aminomethyltransferase
MLSPALGALRQTALNAAHKAAGAKMVEFSGWEMPIEYSGIVQEHVAVRTQAGLFDVSHMGEIEVRGPRALALLQQVTSNDVSRLQLWQVQYTALMHPLGSAVDDGLVYRLGEDHYLVCVNAANTDKDFAWIVQHNSAQAEVRNVSAEYSQLALQGPRAEEILAGVTDADLRGLRYYWGCPATCGGVKGLLSRTGYTGEDGFEFYFPPAESERVWNELLEAGRPLGLIPAGLGARNTLRLEAAYPLYGHELNEETTLLEANLGWIVKFDKGDFLGRQALGQQRAQGTRKKLIGFEMMGHGIARDGYPVWLDGRMAGQVTSGSYAPYLKKNLGLAYVPPRSVDVGQEIEIEIRSKKVAARVVTLPFYRRARSETK